MSLDGIQGTHFDPSLLSWRQQSESAWVKDALRKGEEEARLKAQAAAAPPPPPKPEVSFSDAARTAFEEQLAARSAEKTAGTAEAGAERYAAAQAEGVSLDEWEWAEFSGIPLTELQEKTAKFGGSGGSLTVTSKNGTVVTVTSGRADLSSADIRNTLKITRPDGMQLDLELDGDVRINDSENGSLSVYFPSSGQTCVLDAAGAMTVRQDEAGQSGTTEDDIIINVKGSSVDGGAANDTIQGGLGDDTMLGGAGDDLLVGNGGYDFIDGGAGNDTYLFGTGSGYDHIFEAANGGTDNLYVVGLTDVGIYKQGNHLLIAANNNDVMVLDSWYVNHGVEYIDFEAAQTRYLVSDLANMAVEIQSFGLAEGADMSPAGDVEPITVQGVSALDIPVLA